MDPELRRVLSRKLSDEVLAAIASSPRSARQLAEASGTQLAPIAYRLSALCAAARARPVAPAHPDPGQRVYEIAPLR